MAAAAAISQAQAYATQKNSRAQRCRPGVSISQRLTDRSEIEAESQLDHAWEVPLRGDLSECSVAECSVGATEPWSVHSVECLGAELRFEALMNCHRLEH